MTKAQRIASAIRAIVNCCKVTIVLLFAIAVVLPCGCQNETIDNNPDQIEKRRQQYEKQSMREFDEG